MTLLYIKITRERVSICLKKTYVATGNSILMNDLLVTIGLFVSIWFSTIQVTIPRSQISNYELIHLRS